MADEQNTAAVAVVDPSEIVPPVVPILDHSAQCKTARMKGPAGHIVVNIPDIGNYKGQGYSLIEEDAHLDDSKPVTGRAAVAAPARAGEGEDDDGGE